MRFSNLRIRYSECKNQSADNLSLTAHRSPKVTQELRAKLTHHRVRAIFSGLLFDQSSYFIITNYMYCQSDRKIQIRLQSEVPCIWHAKEPVGCFEKSRVLHPSFVFSSLSLLLHSIYR